jgi:hypothetical protein
LRIATPDGTVQAFDIRDVDVAAFELHTSALSNRADLPGKDGSAQIVNSGFRSAHASVG